MITLLLRPIVCLVLLAACCSLSHADTSRPAYDRVQQESTSGSTSPDHWIYWSGDRVVFDEVDTDGDGNPDIRKWFDENGHIIRQAVILQQQPPPPAQPVVAVYPQVYPTPPAGSIQPAGAAASQSAPQGAAAPASGNPASRS